MYGIRFYVVRNFSKHAVNISILILRKSRVGFYRVATVHTAVSTCFNSRIHSNKVCKRTEVVVNDNHCSTLKKHTHTEGIEVTGVRVALFLCYITATPSVSIAECAGIGLGILRLFKLNNSIIYYRGNNTHNDVSSVIRRSHRRVTVEYTYITVFNLKSYFRSSIRLGRVSKEEGIGIHLTTGHNYLGHCVALYVNRAVAVSFSHKRILITAKVNKRVFDNKSCRIGIAGYICLCIVEKSSVRGYDFGILYSSLGSNILRRIVRA